MIFKWNDRERKMLLDTQDSTGNQLQVEDFELQAEDLEQLPCQNNQSTNDNLLHKRHSFAPMLLIPTTVSLTPLIANYVQDVAVFQPAITTMAGTAQTIAVAATQTPFTDALWPLIRLLQDFALPVGVGVATYGIIEYMLDNPSGKKRVSAALMGYGGVFLIPLFFRAIQRAFSGIGA